MSANRVVVTGVGALTPVGATAQASFAALVEGKSGVAPLSFQQDPRSEVRIGAEVRDFDPDKHLGGKGARRHARFTQLALVAAREALADSGLSEAGYAPERIATILGVGLGGVEVTYEASITLKEHGPRRISPYHLPALIPNIAAGVVSIEAAARGPCYCIASACASAGHAIGDAFDLVRRGIVDAAVTGGAESGVTPLGIAGFERMGALSKRNHEPGRASRPFDRERDGFVLGEGAGMLVLESHEAARRRGATIYGEVLGYGRTADAYHVTHPPADGEGARRAMLGALADGRIDPERVEYINAHGTSTPQNDATESLAIRRALGVHADRVWVSSTKSMTGHLLGGACAVESVAILLSMRHGVVPPTINLEHPDAGCDLDYVPHTARARKIRLALNNAFGFGGQNVCLAFGAI
jgi:3-oxoacyl-[acyl-carrier-protein] synthase II